MEISNFKSRWSWLPRFLCLVVCGLHFGCNQPNPGSSNEPNDGTKSNSKTTQSNAPQESSQNNGLRILFLGNSHTSHHDIPGIVKQLFSADQKILVATESISGPFLESIGSRADVLRNIRDGDWDFIVFQGQKISMSGRFEYSTQTAEELATLANDSDAQVIWFSEWARKDVQGEAERIQGIYETIASKNQDKDQVAPTGLVWQAANSERPNLELHAADGNHSSKLGAALAAMTIYVAITGRDSKDLPDDPLAGLSESDWASFKSTVSQQTQILVTDNKIAKQRADAVAHVLEADSRIGMERNNACKTQPLETTVMTYVDAMNQIDFAGTPASFEMAFRAHIKAWEDSAAFFRQYSQLRGEMHDLFEEISNKDDQSKAELELVEKQIWGTWEAVEIAAKNHKRANEEQP